MKTRLLLLLLLMTSITYAQTPFTTLARELITGKKENNTGAFVESSGANAEETKKVPLSFFNNSSLSMNLINTGNRVSLSSEVLHYKLFFINPDTEKIKTRTYRFNIPLMVISKLSTQYDSINSATS